MVMDSASSTDLQGIKLTCKFWELADATKQYLLKTMDFSILTTCMSSNVLVLLEEMGRLIGQQEYAP